MKRMVLILSAVSLISGCAGVLEKQAPICTGISMIGGQETLVNIYGVRNLAHQTEYKAGAPFGWRWISRTNFESTTCAK